MFGCPYLLLSVAFGFEVLPAVFPFPYTNGKTARPLPKEEEMKLTIFAAIGGIGRQALDQAVAAGPRRHGSRTEPEEKLAMTEAAMARRKRSTACARRSG